MVYKTSSRIARTVIQRYPVSEIQNEGQVCGEAKMSSVGTESFAFLASIFENRHFKGIPNVLFKRQGTSRLCFLFKVCKQLWSLASVRLLAPERALS